MKKWKAKLPGGSEITFESDSPREYMENAGYPEYALEQIVPGMSDCPVDREELLLALKCCKADCFGCRTCPYPADGCAYKLPADALAYITYLEEKLNAKAGGSE